jgi:hypothetical protein
MRKYKLNENYFELINSEEKAYFLGFLFADGYVNEKLNMIDLTLHNKDREILNKFIEFLYPEGRPLAIIRNDYLRLVINSKKITTDLKLQGCFQKKTFNLKFPETINKFLVKHFIRGYFDGDGCVTINKNTLNIAIVGTIDFLNGIKEILNEECKLNETTYDNRHPSRKNNIRALRFGGNIIINRIYHYMYDDSRIYLNRKRKIFLSILENKDYFCNKNYSRVTHQKYFEYKEKQYTKSELSKILSNEIGSPAVTIRKKLTNGWTIDEIINTLPNQWRKKNNII